MRLPRILNNSIATRTTFLVLLLVTGIMLTGGILQMQWVREAAVDDAQRMAKRSMDGAIQIIDNRISNVETAVKTAASYAYLFAPNKSHANKLMERLIDSNQDIDAVTLLYEADYFPEEGRYYAPTIVRNPQSGQLENDEIGGPENDFCYLETDSNWVYTTLLDQGYWCLPYMDSISTQRAMVTYSVPLHDAQGHTYAVMCADVALNWVREIVEEAKPYDYSQVIVMSRDSQYICHPDKQWIQTINVIAHARQTNDTSYLNLTQRMLRGDRGIDTIDKSFFFSDGKNPNADKGPTIVYYAPVERAQWSISFTFPESKILERPNRMRAYMLVFLVVILVLIAIVLSQIIRSQMLPMRQLALSTQQIAKGDFNVSLPDIKSQDEVRFLRDSFEEMQHSLSRYIEELKVSTASKAAIQSELKIASDIQMSMLPKQFPPYPERNDVDVFGSLTPAKAVGGDLYDFFIRDNHLYFCIGDVSGKGVPASLVMAVAMTQFRSVSAHETMPANIITDINHVMAEHNDSNMFVTLFVGVLDLSSGRLWYCNAGHDAPFIIELSNLIATPHSQREKPLRNATLSKREISNLKSQTSNLPVGVVSDWKFTQQEIMIAPDSLIFLYTDGLTEAMNIQQVLFGEERIMDAMTEMLQTTADTGSITPQTLIAQLKEAVHRFVGDAEQSDDLTMLAVKLLHHD